MHADIAFPDRIEPDTNRMVYLEPERRRQIVYNVETIASFHHDSRFLQFFSMVLLLDYRWPYHQPP